MASKRCHAAKIYWVCDWLSPEPKRSAVDCCCLSVTEKHFDVEHAERELSRYLKKGPFSSSRAMLDMLRKEELDGSTILDIGSGIGVLGHELAKHLTHATLVEISRPYLSTAKKEAEKRGYVDRLTAIHGDFVEIADQAPEADVVALDRVVCCYPDFRPLIAASLQKCRRWYLISYPKDRWYTRLETTYKNWNRRRKGNAFRTYIHPADEMRRAIASAGFRPLGVRNTLIWRIEVHARL